MFNRIKRGIKYIKGIRKNISIPVLYASIDLTKANTDKNCTINLNPNIYNQLSEEDINYIKEHLGLVIDKIRDKVDFNK